MSSAEVVSEVVSRIMTERVLTINQACSELGRVVGKRPHKGTVHRWISHGCCGVKLEAVRVGSVTLTSAEAINRFITARMSSL